MPYAEYKDCYSICDQQYLRIGNDRIERTLVIEDGWPYSDALINKTTGYRWHNPDRRVKMFHFDFLDDTSPSLDFSAEIFDHGGLSRPFLRTRVTLSQGKSCIQILFDVAPEMPFVSSRLFVAASPRTKMISEASQDQNLQFANIEKDTTDSSSCGFYIPDHDTVDALGLCDRHLKLRQVQLYDVTDYHDALVKEYEEILYFRSPQEFLGNFFVINSYVNQESLLLVKEGPTIPGSLNRQYPEIKVHALTAVQMRGSGLNPEHFDPDIALPCYGWTVGAAHDGDLIREYQTYYRHLVPSEQYPPCMLSNTWGDRHQDAAVCEEFMLKEIEIASRIGLDLVQIDDGWQKGITQNSALAHSTVWEGYYAVDSAFWSVNSSKFPNGLEPLVKAAREKGLRLGLWFSPDSSHDFQNWEKDADVLLHYYRTYQIACFKLDGIKIRSKQGEVNLIKLLQKVSEETQGQVMFQLDATAEVRLGYLYEKQFGTIFVENRYTDWTNYYPFATFKNLWTLSRYIPAKKLLFELLNIRRNPEKYSPDDVLAPRHYALDYLFATVMVANPLFWMELQHLSEDDLTTLARIVTLYKQERQNFREAEILPIGDLPDGISFSGFQIVVSPEHGYLMLFRDYTAQETFAFQLYDLRDVRIEIELLYTNAEQKTIHLEEQVTPEGTVTVTIPQPRSFAWFQYRVKS